MQKAHGSNLFVPGVTDLKEYRIGEFAKYLGVTPDLLKHYEDQGIIQPGRSGSGYRYYPFNTTMILIECIRLRNYGMTLREIREILTAHKLDNAAVSRRLSENVDHMKEEILLKAVAEKENITVSEEEYEQGCADYALQYGYESADALRQAFDEPTIRISLLMDKTFDYLESVTQIDLIIETETESESEAMTEAET